jgi:O-acetyl-ADP-ribose deacetylase (regulator of RNase III)
MDHFDSGLALSLRKMYPSMYKDFRHYCKLHRPKSGKLWRWKGLGEDGKIVVVYNLMTQEEAPGANAHPGPASISNVRSSLKELAKRLKKDKIKSVSLPKLATGVGSLDWDDVYPLINEYLGDINTDVQLYSTFSQGVEAETI